MKQVLLINDLFIHKLFHGLFDLKDTEYNITLTS